VSVKCNALADPSAKAKAKVQDRRRDVYASAKRAEPKVRDACKCVTLAVHCS
jgi:hypothetical protein